MWRAVLLLDSNARYKERIEVLRGLLSELKNKRQFDTSIVESSTISPDEASKFADEIRCTSPQMRGKIVTSRSHVLPLSGKKNLNLLNTPILVLYRDEKPVTVYPHLIGTFHKEIEDGLREIAEYGPFGAFESRGLLEDPIVKILADDPSLLGSKVKTVAIELATSTGKIDLLMKDDRNIIVVEVETRAGDFAVAQVCRLAAGYCKDNGLPLEKTRRILVCRSFEKNVVETARSADVELYKIALTRQA